MFVFVLQSPVLYHFITVTTCSLTSSIDLYLYFNLVVQVAEDPDTSELEASKQLFVSLIGRHCLVNLHRLHANPRQRAHQR